MVGHNAITLFWTHLDLPEKTIRQLAGLLTEEETTRADRFVFPHLKRRFIAAHGVLRQILHHYTGLLPDKIDFCVTDRGKPELRNGSDNTRVCFNMSHSHDVALYGLGRDCHIGVDIERIRPLAGMEAIAVRNYTAKEVAVLRGLPEDRRNEAFFTFWTLKESCLKATGKGLSDLRKIEIGEIPVPADKVRMVRQDAAGAAWSLYSLPVVSGYAAALAVEKTLAVMPCRRWIVEGVSGGRGLPSSP